MESRDVKEKEYAKFSDHRRWEQESWEKSKMTPELLALVILFSI